MSGAASAAAGESVEPARPRHGLEYHRPVMSRFEGRFEGQADGFDRRAGLPPEAAARVARAVAEVARPFLEERSDAPGSPGLLLEIGAGTGVVGADLAGLVPRYLGMDLSGAMLWRFRDKLSGSAPGRDPDRDRPRALLVRADADAGWPLPSALPPGGPDRPGARRVGERTVRVGAFFLSRSAHLLASEHLTAEILRVADPRGAVLVLGAVRREPGSVRSRMRHTMRHLLSERGIEGRSRERSHERLAVLVETGGGRRETPRATAVWDRTERPAEALAAWRGKPGLAGRQVSPALQEEVLERLEDWAREEWGDLHRPHTSTARYELTVLRLPAR